MFFSSTYSSLLIPKLWFINPLNPPKPLWFGKIPLAILFWKLELPAELFKLFIEAIEFWAANAINGFWFIIGLNCIPKAAILACCCWNSCFCFSNCCWRSCWTCLNWWRNLSISLLLKPLTTFSIDEDTEFIKSSLMAWPSFAISLVQSSLCMFSSTFCWPIIAYKRFWFSMNSRNLFCILALLAWAASWAAIPKGRSDWFGNCGAAADWFEGDRADLLVSSSRRSAESSRSTTILLLAWYFLKKRKKILIGKKIIFVLCKFHYEAHNLPCWSDGSSSSMTGGPSSSSSCPFSRFLCGWNLFRRLLEEEALLLECLSIDFNKLLVCSLNSCLSSDSESSDKKSFS